MSIVTAVRSFLTPTKYYSNNSVRVSKKLQRDGSMLISSFDKNGTLLKTVTQYPIDEFVCNRIHGNRVKQGHRTVVHNIYNNTITYINKITARYEKPLYDALEHNKVLVDAANPILHFDKVTKREEKVVGKAFHMVEYPHLRRYTITHYNAQGEPVSAKKVRIEK